MIRTAQPGLTARRLMVVVAVMTLLAAMMQLVTPLRPAQALNGADFQDGYIISDANFFDAGSMDAGQVQAFLNSQVPNCSGANGQPCLKDYSQATPAIGGDAYCAGLPGGNMSAAQIIVAVGRSCGISPKVLLVMLQKEQALVTSSAPYSYSYTSAMGMGCPDFAACDPAYNGFVYQMYYGARQLQLYKHNPADYGYQLGWNSIQYNPDPNCGSKQVNIRNDATRMLYIYTPYTPNQAALNDLYGSGDSCSAYGNRNFWVFYNNWFGNPTGLAVLGAMGARYQAIGGPSGVLGSPVASEVCNWTPGNVNCYQNFERGAISWTPGTGAWETYGDIRGRWQATGFENGPLGYPVGPPTGGTKDGGWYQNFERGAISWTPGTGAWETYGGIRGRWQELGFENGLLGYPVGAPTCGMKDAGCYQNFQNGAISWTLGTSAWETHGGIRGRWQAMGFENGPIGYPVGPEMCGMKDGGCYQNFQNGAISWTPATGAWETYGEIRGRWQALGFEGGLLGYPVGPPTGGTKDGGWYQNFQNGAVSWTPGTGAWETYGAIRSYWAAQHFEQGPLGYPIGAVTTASAAALTIASAPVLSTTTASSPSTDQRFQGGTIVTSPAGTFQVLGQMNARYQAIGGQSSPLGYPIASEVCNWTSGNVNCYQNFEHGAISWTPGTGAWETYGEIRGRWQALGFEGGVLGYPVGPPTGGTKDGGWYQNFQNGAISWTAATGAWETYGDIRAYWATQHFEQGSLGYPIGPMTSTSTGATQEFQGGTVTWTAPTITVKPRG